VSARAAAGLVLLIAAALGSLALLLQTQEDAEPPAPVARLGVGYYARDARLMGTDESGRALYRIAAGRVDQQPQDGSVALVGVELDYDPATDTPWRLSANEGRLLPGGKMVELTGNVVARTVEPGAAAATIRTDFLVFDPVTRVAATDRKVAIEYAGSIIHATGLRADLRTSRLELLATVSGRYVRP
jgi:lipopolysaccharide export system protein LptC